MNNIDDYKKVLKNMCDISLTTDIKALDDLSFQCLAYGFSDIIDSCLTAALCEAGKRFVATHNNN